MPLCGMGIDWGDKGFMPPYTEPWGAGKEGVEEPNSNLPSEKAPLLFSDWRLNCSNSGFWSTGMTRGEAAAVERTLEDGGLQLPALEAKTSTLESTCRPK